MDSKAQLTVDIIAKVVEGKISIANATKLLNKSRRSIERYIKRYQEVGIQFVVHGNCGKSPPNKTPISIKKAVQALIKDKYFDLNLLHLAEQLAENEHIVVKRETLRGWAHDIHHVKRAKRRRSHVRIGISIGKNSDVPVEEAICDYRTCLRAVYTVTDYVAVDISSPNTTGLFELQAEPLFSRILKQLKDEQVQLAQQHGLYTPIAIKLSPDLNRQEIERISNALMSFELDGVIATNTTRLRPGMIAGTRLAKEEGGLSGRPLLKPSTEIVRQLYQHLRGSVPIIGCGGIFDPEDAWSKLCAGASLVQLYTGFAYHGPALVRRIVEDLVARAADSGTGELAAILAAAHARIATPDPR